MRRLLAGLALAALVPACGTTVNTVAGGAAMQGGGLSVPTDGISAGVPLGGPDGTIQLGGPAGISPDGPAGVSLVAPNGAAGTRSDGSGAASGSAEGTGESATETGQAASGPVKIGLLYIDGADQAASALGISGLATGDAVAQAEALVEWANTRGGLAGRRIDLSTYGVKVSEGDPGVAQERGCVALAEDAKVQLVISYVNLLANTFACFAKYGVGVVDDAAGILGEVAAKNPDTLVSPGDIEPGRLVGVLVDALVRTGWLTTSSTIGAYTYDTPDNVRLLERYLTPALARHGLKISETARVSNDANGVAQNSNVVLQFRTNGVDRILPILASPLFLMQAAESQQYRPRYATYSLFGPGALLETAAPVEQQRGSRGIGYSPYLDIGAGRKPGPVSANETLCFTVMEQSGQQSAAPTTKALQTQLCNAVFYLKAAADRVGTVPADLFRRAGPLLGRSFPPADTFASDLGAGRHDGASAYRDLVFDDSCSCYQYSTGNLPTP